MNKTRFLQSRVALLAILFVGLSVIFLPTKVTAQRSFYEGKSISEPGCLRVTCPSIFRANPSPSSRALPVRVAS